ncbi:hypothetical protein MCOL2_02931, partial [Listeria fleischmannii FSL S10-1203]
ILYLILILFKKVIDELGGIDVQVPKDFEGPILDTGKKVQV